LTACFLKKNDKNLQSINLIKTIISQN